MEYRCYKTICKKTLILILACLLLGGCACRDHRAELGLGDIAYVDKTDSLLLLIKNNGVVPPEVILHSTAFHTSYNPEWKIPNWVAYILNGQNLHDKHVGKVKIKSEFQEDSLIVGARATLEDYRKSGWSRGHMIPVADLQWNEVALNESYKLTNICPQDLKFNSGKWATLENSIRKLAKKDNTIIVICGPIVEPFATVIGENRVTVPQKFFKVLLKKRQGKYNAIGFIFPNQDVKGSIFDFAVPVDSVEQKTGWDFFYQLVDSIENQVETEWKLKDWQ